jgi:LCP family protein required for cell wall assembly
MADDRPDDQPQYTLYRSRPRLPWKKGDDGVTAIRPQPGEPREPRRRRLPRITPRRVLTYVVLALAGWLLLSLVLFLVSAQIESSKVSDAASSKLSGGGYPLTSPNTILVLGSDARAKGTKEPGAQTIGQPSRSDSIMLLRIGGGANAQLSILRDTVVDIPGHGRDKINAAYAYGGPSLAIETVEQFLGVDVNHLVEVNFENFPELIDALGGVTVKTPCVDSEISGGRSNGGYTLRLKAGSHELDGEQALTYARTRKNACRPQEDDHARVRRQQQVLNAMKSKVTSFETFIRLPWVSWAAPKAVRSDMSGPTLLGLVGAELTGGTAKHYVFPDERSGTTVDEAAKQRVVEQFMKG